MNNLYIIIAIIISMGILYKVRVNGKKFRDLEAELEAMKRMAAEAVKEQQKPPPEVKVPSLSYETHKKHMVVVNSDQNVVQVDLPYTLKNVVHAELISGIFPKSEKRINQYNNNLNIDSNLLSIRTGSYSDIISLLMQVNQQIYDAGTSKMIIMFDAVERSLIAVSNTAAGSAQTFDFNVLNSMADVLGYEEGVTYDFTTSTLVPDSNVITSSLTYFTDLKSKSQLNNKAINNLPYSVYTFTDQYYYNGGAPPNPMVHIDPNWKYIRGVKRVNMKHQLYLDVELDQVEYWDGSHRLARVYIPESADETEYTAYGSPIRRSFREECINLDRLTFRLKSIQSETRKHDYGLNGLNYSLQVEFVTLNNLLESNHTILLS